jgi:putative transposase
MQSFVNIWIHLVWTTKNREPLLQKDLKILVCKHIIENAKKKEHHIDYINGVEDHLHCLIKLKSSVPLSKVVNDIKGESSNWFNKNNFIENQFEWQDGYGAFSVSPQNVEMVRNYIKKQEEHHKKKTFEEELNFFENLIKI